MTRMLYLLPEENKHLLSCNTKAEQNMKQVLLLLTILITNFGFSQKSKITKHGNDTIEVINYYKNGRVKDSVWKTVEVLVGKPDKIDPKHPGDSIVMNIETPFGISKSFYKKGKLKAITYYGSGNQANQTFEYRKNGKLQSYKEFPYGLRKTYNKKGKQVREANYNKNKFVRIPKSCKNQKHLSNTRFNNTLNKTPLTISNNTKNIKINNGAMLSLRLQNDTNLLRHYVYEGKSSDSLVFSVYDYDLSESKDKLRLNKVYAVSPAQIESICYASKNNRNKYNWGGFMEVTGFSMTFLPLVGGTVFFGTAFVLSPAVLATIVAGLPVYICSKPVYKKTVPKTYKLNEWIIKN